jgi:hypothetical protein
LLATEQQPDDPQHKRPDVMINEKSFKKPVRVKKGDVIEVRLKGALPAYWWAEDGLPSILRKVGETVDEPLPNGTDVPTLNGGYLGVDRYEVIKDPAEPVTLKLMYCRPPTQEERLARIRPDDPSDRAFWTRRRIERKEIKRSDFRPDLELANVREGMVFQFTLQSVNEAPKKEASKE